MMMAMAAPYRGLREVIWIWPRGLKAIKKRPHLEGSGRCGRYAKQIQGIRGSCKFSLIPRQHHFNVMLLNSGPETSATSELCRARLGGEAEASRD